LQRLQQGAFPGAVRAEKERDRSERHNLPAPERLEILDDETDWKGHPELLMRVAAGTR
jgi:hypothetical protein